ncbi:MAG TPA: TRIC cation channel family protein, partial [Thermomicrobiales bacterium]|nr:TRIC cation channel family protein [Thermomicrobiales bacterium]
IIGATPPAAIDDWRYLGVSLVAGLFTFGCAPLINRLSSPVLILDAGGLGLFAVSGATKALEYHLDPIPAMLLGMLTGIGGGVLRDVLVAEIPSVLRENLYAVAALAGAAVVVIGHGLGLPPTPTALAGAALCIGLRVISIRRGWQLPRASLPAPSPVDAPSVDRSKRP